MAQMVIGDNAREECKLHSNGALPKMGGKVIFFLNYSSIYQFPYFTYYEYANAPLGRNVIKLMGKKG